MRGYLKIMIFMHFPTQYRSSGIQFRVVVISVLTVTPRALLRHLPHPGRRFIPVRQAYLERVGDREVRAVFRAPFNKLSVR